MLTDPALWKRIDACNLTRLGNGLFFEKLLAEVKNVNLARRAIREYKKFMYLAYISPDRVVPSYYIDKVWHIHLIFTKHYWDEFCPNVLGKRIHHTPSEDTKDYKNVDSYDLNKTENLYEREFDLPPIFFFTHRPLRTIRNWLLVLLGKNPDKYLFNKTSCGNAPKNNNSGCSGCSSCGGD